MSDAHPLSMALQQAWQLVDNVAARGEALRLDRAETVRFGASLHRIYHLVMALEMRAAELEAVAQDLDPACLDLISYAKSGEIGPGGIGPRSAADRSGIVFTDGRPQIELTAAGYEALGAAAYGESGEHAAPAVRPLGVGPLCGAVVDAGSLFERRRLETIQRRLQAALDAGDEDEAERVLAELPRLTGLGAGPAALVTPTGGDAA